MEPTSSGFGAGRPRVVSVPLLEIMALVDDITERDEPSGVLCRWLSCVAPASFCRPLPRLVACRCPPVVRRTSLGGLTQGQCAVRMCHMTRRPRRKGLTVHPWFSFFSRGSYHRSFDPVLPHKRSRRNVHGTGTRPGCLVCVVCLQHDIFVCASISSAERGRARALCALYRSKANRLSSPWLRPASACAKRVKRLKRT